MNTMVDLSSATSLEHFVDPLMAGLKRGADVSDMRVQGKVERPNTVAKAFAKGVKAVISEVPGARLAGALVGAAIQYGADKWSENKDKRVDVLDVRLDDKVGTVVDAVVERFGADIATLAEQDQHALAKKVAKHVLEKVRDGALKEAGRDHNAIVNTLIDVACDYLDGHKLLCNKAEEPAASEESAIPTVWQDRLVEEGRFSQASGQSFVNDLIARGSSVERGVA